MNNIVTEVDLSSFGLECCRGKVRDTFDLEKLGSQYRDQLLVVTTDRISALDMGLTPGIPEKGKVLTAVSTYWFNRLSELGIQHHLLTTDVREAVPELQDEQDLEGRSMVVKKLDMVLVEAVVRGHITGNLWRSYQEGRPICNLDLPDGLTEDQRLEQPVFTGSTKAEPGDSDEYLPLNELAHAADVPMDILREIESISLRVFQKARIIAQDANVCLVDTKFEFGQNEDGEIVLADEVLTSDSSRYWGIGQNGKLQKGLFDKDIVKDHVRSRLPTEGGIHLPEHIVEQMSQNYQRLRNVMIG